MRNVKYVNLELERRKTIQRVPQPLPPSESKRSPVVRWVNAKQGAGVHRRAGPDAGADRGGHGVRDDGNAKRYLSEYLAVHNGLQEEDYKAVHVLKNY